MPISGCLFKIFLLRVFIISGLVFLPAGTSSSGSVMVKDHHIKSFDGRTIYVKEKYTVDENKSAGVVVCFAPCIHSHEFFDCPVSDYSLMDFLARKGFRVFAYDRRGFGFSYHPPDGKITYEVMLRDAESVVKFVLTESRVKTVSMVAFGFGAQIACCHAVRHPEQVDALALMDFVWKVLPVPKPHLPQPDNKEMLLSQPNGYMKLSSVADFFGWTLRFTTPEIRAWVKGTFTEAPVGPLLTADSLPLIKSVEKMHASILIIRGTRADITTQADSFDFLTKISSQIRAMEALEGAGPIPSLEREFYQTVFKDIAWFFSR